MWISCRKQVRRRPCHFISDWAGLHKNSWCVLPSECYSLEDRFIISHELNKIMMIYCRAISMALPNSKFKSESTSGYLTIRRSKSTIWTAKMDIGRLRKSIFAEGSFFWKFWLSVVKLPRNCSSQPPKACFNQNFSKFRPDQKFLKHNEMKPLGIDMWWIIKSSTTVSFDKWWRKKVFQRFLMSLTKAENQDTLPPQPIRLGLNRRRVF